MDKQGKKFKAFTNKDLFPQLTDDLLILILSMLNCDLKFLCQCMLISKRFALLIPHISSGTLSIPEPQERSPFKFFQAQATYAFKALKSFRNIRSLHLELIEEDYRVFDLEWKAVFGSKTYTCACIASDSITKLSSISASARVGASAADSQRITAAVAAEQPTLMHTVFPNLWRNLFVTFQPIINSVVITDLKRQGKVCFGITELRDGRACTSILDALNNWFEKDRTSLKFFKVPELRLPKSGFLIKGVCLAIIKIGGNLAEDHKYDELLNCDFGEEHGVLGEALDLLLRTPENEISDLVVCPGTSCPGTLVRSFIFVSKKYFFYS